MKPKQHHSILKILFYFLIPNILYAQTCMHGNRVGPNVHGCPICASSNATTYSGSSAASIAADFGRAIQESYDRKQQQRAEWNRLDRESEERRSQAEFELTRLRVIEIQRQQELLRQREAEIERQRIAENEQLDQAFREVAATMGIINGTNGQPLLESVNSKLGNDDWRGGLEDLFAPPQERYVDETPPEFQDRVLGYQDGLVVEVPDGMTRADALAEIEQAKREAQEKQRALDNTKNELLDLLDKAKADAKDLRDGGVFPPSKNLPGKYTSEDSPVSSLADDLKLYIREREQIDDKAQKDPVAPKQYIRVSEQLQGELKKIFEKGTRKEQFKDDPFINDLFDEK